MRLRVLHGRRSGIGAMFPQLLGAPAGAWPVPCQAGGPDQPLCPWEQEHSLGSAALGRSVPQGHVAGLLGEQGTSAEVLS